MKKIRIGVVGVGYLGKFHAEKYANMENVDLVGVVDIDKVQAINIAKKFSTKAYGDHKELLGMIDAASIVVPTRDHYNVSKDFLIHGIDVLIEKPITTTLEEADSLLELAASGGLILQVGQLERFNPAVLALKEIIDNPMFIESHRLGLFKNRGTDVSVVLDLMIHDIDIIQNFVDTGIASIHASGVPVISEHVDIANARVEFNNGSVANITASRISTKNERKIRLFQKDAYISVDFANQEITLIMKNKDKTNGLIPGMEIKHLSFPKVDALKNEIVSFVKAVSQRNVPEVTGQMGRDALKTALTMMEQIRNSNKRILKL